MNPQKATRKKKGISPVLAEVLLIAITFIAAIAIAGFVFGLFGTFTKTARVSAGGATCVDSTGVCTLTVTNTGTGNTNLGGTCGETYGGTTYTGKAALTAGSLNAGDSGTVTCTPTAAVAISAGAQVTGSISLTNGGSVYFSGTG